MHRKLKHILSFVFVAILLLSSKAQTFSPQSQFGLGNLHNPTFSNNKAMGGVSAGYRDARTLNYLNPASLSALNYTTFNMGLHMYANVISDSVRLTDAANGGIDHISLAFPVMQNRWGMSLGLMPYSYKKYSYNNTFTEDDVTYDAQSNATGSTYKLFVGNGFQYKNFSAGFNTSFVFGQLDETQEILFADSLNNVNTSNHSKMNIKDFTVDFGLQYKVKLNKLENQKKDVLNKYMVVGVYGAPSFNLKSLSSKYTNSSITSSSGAQIPVDSIPGGVYNEKTQTKLPAYFGAGVTFTNDYSWTIGTDFHFQNWKKFSSPINDLALANEWKIKLGGEIIPDYKSRKFVQSMTYRLGTVLGKSRVMVDNQSLPEFGMTFGLGIPIGRAKTSLGATNMLNLSLEAGRIGLNNSNSYKENYYKITLGYSLSDRWFIKRKFD